VWRLLLKFDDAAVVADVDGEALSLERFDLTVNGFAQAPANVIDLLIEDLFLSLVRLHP